MREGAKERVDARVAAAAALLQGSDSGPVTSDGDATVMATLAEDVSSFTYGLTSASPAASKSFVFVKLTEQALLAIEQYVQQVSP